MTGPALFSERGILGLSCYFSAEAHPGEAQAHQGKGGGFGDRTIEGRTSPPANIIDINDITESRISNSGRHKALGCINDTEVTLIRRT